MLPDPARGLGVHGGGSGGVPPPRRAHGATRRWFARGDPQESAAGGSRGRVPRIRAHGATRRWLARGEPQESAAGGSGGRAPRFLTHGATRRWLARGEPQESAAGGSGGRVPPFKSRNLPKLSTPVDKAVDNPAGRRPKSSLWCPFAASGRLWKRSGDAPETPIFRAPGASSRSVDKWIKSWTNTGGLGLPHSNSTASFSGESLTSEGVVVRESFTKAVNFNGSCGR
jgi:hypothetical protein